MQGKQEESKMSQEVTAVHIAVAQNILKKRKADAEKEQEKQAAADAEKQRATVQLQSRPQSINAVFLRNTWDKFITQPNLKKAAAREAAKIAVKPAKKSSLQKLKPAKVQAVAKVQVIPAAVQAELYRMEQNPRTVEGRTQAEKIEIARQAARIRAKQKINKGKV